jgi:uracil-DNA glycosylase
MKALEARLAVEYKANTIFPAQENIFAALNLTPLPSVKAVILGQDPYHGAGQAHGLSFSVREGTPLPPSLKNIFVELSENLSLPPPKSGDLTRWAKEGVLLLNSILTVEEGKPGSHSDFGWQDLTDQIIRIVSEKRERVAFLLWGSHAQKKEALIDRKKHLIIKTPHPSPLSSYRGFFGSKPFEQTNSFLRSQGISEINWAL